MSKAEKAMLMLLIMLASSLFLEDFIYPCILFSAFMVVYGLSGEK